jgi:hypothetical protein
MKTESRALESPPFSGRRLFPSKIHTHDRGWIRGHAGFRPRRACDIAARWCDQGRGGVASSWCRHVWPPSILTPLDAKVAIAKAPPGSHAEVRGRWVSSTLSPPVMVFGLSNSRVKMSGLNSFSQPASTGVFGVWRVRTQNEGTSSMVPLTEAVDTAETPAMFADGGLCAAAAFSRQ